MFKRILSALKRKKNVVASGNSTSVHDTDTTRDGEALITAYDESGREIKIARSEWRDKVFIPEIRKKWNDADGLHNVIIWGLNDGFAVDLRPAAERLLQIDTIPERGYTTLGIVLLEAGELDAAEKVLREAIAKVGETAILLTNLAKVFNDRGDHDLTEQTLWKAVQAEPNEEHGLRFWASIQQERGGDSAYVQALHTAADLPQSWRAKLWLARHYLEHREIDAARKLYAEVIALAVLDAKALTTISGDLGNNGQIALIPDLISPLYDEHKHDPHAGINLLHAYKELGKIDDGTALLNRMYALGFPPIKQQLDQFSHAFQKMRDQPAHNHTA